MTFKLFLFHAVFLVSTQFTLERVKQAILSECVK